MKRDTVLVYFYFLKLYDADTLLVMPTFLRVRQRAGETVLLQDSVRRVDARPPSHGRHLPCSRRRKLLGARVSHTRHGRLYTHCHGGFLRSGLQDGLRSGPSESVCRCNKGRGAVRW